jgi:uncharacterized protein YkwD
MRFLPIAAILLVLASAWGSASSADAATGARRFGALESAIAREINATRVTRGLGSLSRSQGLTRAADAHTTAMLGVGRFDHDLPGFPTFVQRMRRYYAPGAATWDGGENLALFGPDAPTALEVVAAWLASPAHREILLDRGWRDLGLAVRYADAAGGEFGDQPVWLITLDVGRRG